MNDDKVFELIAKKIIDRKKFNDPYDEIYVRRLEAYQEFLKMPYWYKHREYIYIKKYLESINFKGKMLDFGCGSGHMDVLLARDGFNVHGIDISPLAIEICQVLKENEPIEIQNRLGFTLEDVEKEGLVKDFDFVWSSHTLEHIENHRPIFEGLRKRVKKGSLMRVDVPLGYAFNDKDHVHHWMNDKDFREYFEQFVQVEEVTLNSYKETITGNFIL